MNVADFHEIFSIFLDHDVIDRAEAAVEEDLDTASLRASLETYFAGRELTRSVLGIDIYQYSQLVGERQRLIPSVFQFLYGFAFDMCSKREELLFDTESKEKFISTGDGGFQIFTTPMHALLFAAYFQFALTIFNGYFTLPKVRRLMGALSVRYAITTDKVFKQDDNFYGPALINNARILSRDSLNRCLIDGSSIEWFDRYIGNVESLLGISGDDLKRVLTLSPSNAAEARTHVLGRLANGDKALRSLHVQKIGLIRAKQTPLDIYNLQMQVLFRRLPPNDPATRLITVTLGNLNVSGISE